MKMLKKILREKNMNSLLASLSSAALGLISFMLLTRQLPQVQFGDWVLYITLGTFIDALRFGFTRTSVVRLLSGAVAGEQKGLLGAGYKIGLLVLLAISACCYTIYFTLGYFGVNLITGYDLFLIWYPVLGLASLGWKSAFALFQAEQKFNHMMVVRLSNIGLFVLFLVANGLFLGWGLLEIVWVNIAVNLISSVWCTLKRWDGMLYIHHSTKAVEREMVGFGKYAMGTLVGSSLLKSADTFIIGLSPILGSAGIAMYAIPLKLTDLLGIPLRSFTMTAYPRMSKKNLSGDLEAVRHIFYTYSGIVTLLFLPVAVFCFVFAEYMVLVLGGKQYVDQLPLLTLIFRIFTCYTLLLPIDRFTGVLLDSINKPRLNLNKVIYMAVANVIINLIAVFVFESLVVVAVGTVVFTLLGIFIGLRYVKKEIQADGKQIFKESLQFVKKFNLSALK
ncbi:Polysaccharide biosynthesis protein [Croceitalea dokdonensis DOKDO 023]|uniref:Polysaccharide biosynthesis protein n=1 Tax=Croceitalea dokdonensis DOKDO 023 TaxID=1300341 RepID=A0A0P7ATB6_9FLAO|nr:oligosaccharide flippase family protein [Croceitalea dokdonensis]KPM31193.1 Polysaccharide biosynthesis protein [Croceitalea dokdonensis DOKDO 023]